MYIFVYTLLSRSQVSKSEHYGEMLGIMEGFVFHGYFKWGRDGLTCKRYFGKQDVSHSCGHVACGVC